MKYRYRISMLLAVAYSIGVAQNYSYVIVVHDSLVDEVQPLADWKDAKGCTTYIAPISWIENNHSGRDRSEKIRNFVAHSDSAWPNFQYLLLAGDTATVPPRYVIIDSLYGQQCTVPSDDYYTNLVTNWDLDNDSIFGEDSAHCSQGIDEIDFYNYSLYTGRLPSDNPAEMSNMVDKIITYEQSPPTGDWPERMMFCASLWNVADSLDCIDAKESVYDNDFPHPNDFQITRLYESIRLDFDSLSVSRFLNCFNQGTSIVNSVSHGLSQHFIWYIKQGNTWIPGDYITTNHASTVTNGYKLPMIVACACGTAQFDDTVKCLGETFMTALNGGCIVYIGASRFDLPQEYFFYDNLFGPAQKRAGVAWRMAKHDELLEWGPGFDPSWRFHYIQAVLFGDPELAIRTEPVGISENYTKDIDDYHPVRSVIVSGPIQLPSDKPYKIYDITGRQIHTLNPAPGIYFIEVDGEIKQKVVKVR